jgi:metal-responsive CopG/Arc/MetJ family transcriptional regulator
MPSILIEFDEASLRALDCVVPVAKRGRAEFIRQAVKEAIRKQEFAKICEGYLQQPDTAEADGWSTVEEFTE